MSALYSPRTVIAQAMIRKSKGKPVARRGRKASGLSGTAGKTAGLPAAPAVVIVIERTDPAAPPPSPSDSTAQGRLYASVPHFTPASAPQRVPLLVACAGLLLARLPGRRTRSSLLRRPEYLRLAGCKRHRRSKLRLHAGHIRPAAALTLRFAIANKPAWASFSASSGELAGAPGAASAGTYANIVIAVSDGTRTATLPAFAVQVLAAASVAAPPPVISGTPAASVTAGSAYDFQPRASDPTGLPLSFSVQNKPAWAAFSIASGLMSGTPTSAQTGTYASVVISTSDGQHSSALPAFSITVNAPAAAGGSAVLAVTPPAQNTDGTALTDLAGYRIYYGTSPSNLSQLAQLASSSPSTYTASTLTSGTWYFGATAYTTAGTESAMSTLVSKTIP